MSTPLKVLTGIAVLFVVGAIALMTLFTRIQPWHYGVKQNLIAKEIAEVDSTTGFVLRIPGVHTWHMIDRRTHFVTFADVDRDSSLGRTRPSLVFRTKDNNTVTYDLTVTYKVKDGEAHMLVREGNAKRYKELVVGIIESTMRSELAQLSSEEVFSTDQRIKVGNDALPALGEALEEYHVVPDAVLIRAIRFEPNYEAKLQAKQLTYQELELARAQRVVEDERGKTETKAAEIEAAVKELTGDRDKLLQQVSSDNLVAIAEVEAEANIYDRETRARADATYETAVANGTLALEQAEALRNELRNRALDTTGGRIYLAQQAAENLDFESVTLNSNDPRVPSVIDIGAMVRLLVGEDD
ncbi:MAG: SPFH domain-containing protein [Planctomycetota bacterium]